MQHDETKQQVNRAIYALLSLTVGGVMAFAVYVVKDLSQDIQVCRSMLVAIHQEIAEIKAVQAMRNEQLTELKRQVIEMDHVLEKR